ncbi:MAG: hypothetical protein R3326_02605 [Gemmatimonadota bacterium]|nr:hypothetical protein [Gemmatimonadota bacterium]
MADTVRTAVVGALTLLVVGAAACSTETELTIMAQGENAEGETVPLSNVKLDVIPYDIDELYDELESQTQPGSPPAADSLSVLAREYQEQCAAYRATSDSIEMVRQRATQIQQREGETSDAYREAFGEYQALVQREEQRFEQCQEVTDIYTGVRNQYREERTAWEEQAWPADEFAAAESTRVGDKPVQTVETGPEGMASVTVPNGDWWILGTAPVPGSISQQYRWNVEVTAEGGQDTVRLTGENAETQPVF